MAGLIMLIFAVGCWGFQPRELPIHPYVVHALHGKGKVVYNRGQDQLGVLMDDSQHNLTTMEQVLFVPVRQGRRFAFQLCRIEQVQVDQHGFFFVKGELTNLEEREFSTCLQLHESRIQLAPLSQATRFLLFSSTDPPSSVALYTQWRGQDVYLSFEKAIGGFHRLTGTPEPAFLWTLERELILEVIDEMPDDGV